ncbi:MAG TPA: TlpA disulfide reductase family protein, partial [Candidatus Obscuribacterales bacterium]
VEEDIFDMVALAQGTKAPAFTLKGVDGQTYSLESALQRQPVVLLAFFKVSCPVCQFAFPYLERLHRSYRTIPIWGISQDDADATIAFARMYGSTFPMLLDELLDTTVKYDLTNVPSLFLVSSDQLIKATSVGFVKAELESLNSELAMHAQQTIVPLFTAADEVPELKPG